MEELNELIKEGEDVGRNCFRKGRTGIPDRIYGEDFSKWIYKCKLFFVKNFDKKEIPEVLKRLSESSSCVISDYKTIMGLLKAYTESKCVTNNQTTNNKIRNKKIFVSHCSKDRLITDKVVDLLKIIGVKDTQIYYSSYDETGADYLEDCLDRIKKEFEENELMVLFMISRNFYKSKVCLAEMGATWVTSFERYIPILLPPLEYRDIDGVIKSTQNGILLSSNEVKIKLGQFKEKVEDYLGIEDKVSSSEWDRARDNFIERIQELQKDFKEVDCTVDDMVIENDIFIAKLRAQNNTKSRLVLEGVTISVKLKNEKKIEGVIDDWSVTSVVLQPLEIVTFVVTSPMVDKIRNSDILRDSAEADIKYYERK